MVWQLGKRKKALPIGVDLGTSDVRVVQLAMDGEDLDIQAAASLTIPPHLISDQIGRLDFLRQHLPIVLRDQPFRGRRCVLCLPGDNSFVRHVKVPKLNAKGMEAAVRQAAQADLPYPINEAVIRHIVAGEVYADGQKMQEVIVVAIPLATLDAYLRMTHQVGLEVVGVNIEPVATVDCFSGLFAWANDAERKVLYVNLRSNNTLAVVAHGSNVVFARKLPFGSRQVDRAIAEGLDVMEDEAVNLRWAIQNNEPCEVTPEEAYRFVEPWIARLSEELDHCLLYYRSAFRPTNVERIIFTGMQASDKRLCQALAQRLNLAAQIGDPMMGLRNSLSHDHGPDTTVATRAQPELCVAIGLSLGGMADG